LRTSHLRLLACILVGAVLPGIVAAADLYRWVDDQGTPHVSDRPPPNPPANMTRESMPAPVTMPPQRADTREPVPAAQGRARTPDHEGSKGTVRPAAPVATPAGSQDCKARWDAYQRSQACFAPYRTADAGMKPEAFAACGPDLADPAPDCGPLR
jgi:hypothetical protein